MLSVSLSLLDFMVFLIMLIMMIFVIMMRLRDIFLLKILFEFLFFGLDFLFEFDFLEMLIL